MNTTLDKVIYTAKVTTTGGREGAAKSDDGRIDLKMSTPGGPGGGTNPEQLLAAGWSACYLSACAHVARQRKATWPAGAAVATEIDLGTNAGGYQLRARMNVHLPGLDRALAQSIADEAHGVCPYSKGLHGNVDVTTTVTV